MMGYMSLLCTCISCGRLFTANPDLVPSVRVNGVKEPVCRPCIEQYRPEWVPQIPPGAYSPATEHPDDEEGCWV